MSERQTVGPETGIGQKRKLAPDHAAAASKKVNGSFTEQDILASLGSSIQNMDEYEQNVLHSAELEQTPRLSGMGFPSLSALAPSSQPMVDLSHFQNVLKHVRQKLEAQPHNLQLLLQQQMLLNVIHTTTNDFDLCLRPQQELKQEQLRKQRFRKQTKSKDPTPMHLERPVVHQERQKGPLKSALKGVPPPATNPTATDKEEMQAAQRLENIKQKQKNVSFAAGEDDSKSNTTLPRRRIGIQKRRRRENGDAVEEESEEDLEKRKEHLRKLRQKREQRQKLRQDRWEEKQRKSTRKDSSARVAKKGAEDEEEETGLEFNIEGTELEEKKDDDTAAPSKMNQSANVTAQKRSRRSGDTGSDPSAASAVATSPFKTNCPLCQEEMSSADQKSLDEKLSLHLAGCQSTRRQTRVQRRSSRQATAKPISYAEDDSVGEEEDQRLETSRARRYLAIKPPILSYGDIDQEHKASDITDFLADSEDEDEPLVADTMQDVQMSEDDLKSETGNSTTSHDETPVAPKALDDFDEDDYEDRVDDWIENGIGRMRVMKERDDDEESPGEDVYDGGLVIPAWINDRLFPYQRTGLQWMWELHQQQAGGIVGDEMGLGKTVQLCSFLGCMAASRKLKSTLIIAPATMLQHWLSELKIWAPGIRRILIHQSADSSAGPLLSTKRTISKALLRNVDHWLKECRRDRLFEAIDEEDYKSRDPSSFCGTGYAFVTTYENLRRNPDIWTHHAWSYIVMDEAQKIRNPDADITLVCKRLRTPHRLALSGTPIMNDLRELWSLFDFVFPGRLGTLPAFENEFADPIKRGGYSNASPMQVQLAYRCALVLRDLINPYLLRRLKRDIKEVNRMPGKKEQVLFCRLSKRQRIMYEAFLQSDQVKQVMRGSTQMLGAITMLRKICNHPDLVCPPDQSSLDSFVQKGSFNEADLAQDYSDDDDGVEGEDSVEDSLTERSGKLEVLANILPLWKSQGHRVLIFCQWKKMLNIIQRFTETQGWKFGRLDGNTNVAARQRLVDNFNSDYSYYGMLMTTRTGGVGLNLTGADRVILYDPDWNPQTDAQARERAWRFGQQKEVTIYRLIAAGTVEEKIYQRQIFKTALSNRVLQDPKQRRLFSQKDLKDLFSLKVDDGSVATGSEGITETGHLTKGEGYVDPDVKELRFGTDEGGNDDGDTMQSVLRSKGLAGVFDHDLVESNRPSLKASIREMEANAAKVARAAVGALKQSVAGHQAFTPTWTGTEETQNGGRFGDNSVIALAPGSENNVAGICFMASSKGTAGSPGGSSSLLATIRQRNEAVAAEGNGGMTKNTTKEYTALLHRIRDFVRRRIPTTDEILDEFASVKSYDAAVFRRLLKSVATIKNGRWRLKQNVSTR